MPTQSNKNLKALLHPYIFVLKEGGGIKDNFLDYSLMMLLVTSPETIKSPKKSSKAPKAKAKFKLDLTQGLLGAAFSKNS